MRRYLILLLLLTIPLVCRGDGWFYGSAAGETPACDVLLCGDMEGTGAENGWAGSGDGYDFDFSTSGLSLEGSQCLRLDSSSDTATGSFSSASEVWGKFMWRTTADSAYIDVFKLRASTTVCATVYDGGTNLDWEFGTASGSSTFNKAADTTYYVWFHYKKETSGDGLWEVFISTNTTKPETRTLGASGGPGGSSTSNVDNIWFARSTGSGYNYYDDIWVSNSSTGWETW